MELNENKIKPTTSDESALYKRMLKAQIESTYSKDTQVPKVRKNVELSEADSYKLFCAMEKVLHQGYEFMKFDDNELDIVIGSVRTMAKSQLDTVASTVENFSIESAQSIEPASRNIVVEMASRALRPSIKAH